MTQNLYQPQRPEKPDRCAHVQAGRLQDGRRYVVKRHGAAGSHIIKLPSTHHPDLAFNEYMGYLLCDRVGLDCALAALITRQEADLPEVVAFDYMLAVKRFDRTPHGRVHMEEFAQIFGLRPAQKYGSDLIVDYGDMLGLINQRSLRPVVDVQEFLNRLVAFILMGNTDAHLKNWALCAFGWDAMGALIDRAGLRGKNRFIRRCREVVAQAKADWPAMLAADYTPANVRTEVLARLEGKVALAQ